jgi:hypothetical protein
LKGKERVCNVTEADMPRARRGPVYPEKCLHVRPLGVWGFAPVRGGFCGMAFWVGRVG